MGKSISLLLGRAVVDHFYKTSQSVENPEIRRSYSEPERRSWKIACFCCSESSFSSSSVLWVITANERSTGESKVLFHWQTGLYRWRKSGVVHTCPLVRAADQAAARIWSPQVRKHWRVAKRLIHLILILLHTVPPRHTWLSTAISSSIYLVSGIIQGQWTRAHILSPNRHRHRVVVLICPYKIIHYRLNIQTADWISMGTLPIFDTIFNF